MRRTTRIHTEANLVDLHTHTTASDGSLSPAELVQTALSRGLRILGLTDHDSTDGIDAALAAAKGTGLEVWPGTEMSTDVPAAEIHLLGYFIRHHDAAFQLRLSMLRDGRLDRAQRIVRRLADLGKPIEWERVAEIAGEGAVGRPHVAQAMVEKGYVRSTTEAFDLYLGRNGPAYVERYKLTPVEAARLVVSAGGLPVLAHPVIIGDPADAGEYARNPRLPDHIDAALPQLVDEGLAGLEAYYPDYPPALTAYLEKLADRLGLAATGGSDYHGPKPGFADLGSIHVPMEGAARLRQIAASRQG